MRDEGRGTRDELKDLEEVHTPNMKTVDEVGKFLNEKPEKFIKTLIYLADEKPLMVLVKGDCEINEEKLKSHIKANELVLADSDTVQKISGAPVGFAGPVHLPLTTYHLPLLSGFLLNLSALIYLPAFRGRCSDIHNGITCR